MAEVLLKIGDGAGFEDGDPVAAYSDHWIRFKAAEKICATDSHLAQRNRDDLIVDPLHLGYHRLLYQYEKAMISSTEVVRFDRFTGETVVINLDAAEFVRRRKRRIGRHKIFEVGGRVTWFDGYLDLSESNVSSIWDHIENTSDHERTEHRKFRLGRKDFLSFVPVSCNMTHQQSLELMEPTEADPEKRVKGKDKGRRFHVRHWAAALRFTVAEEARIRNPRKSCDFRDSHSIEIASFTDKKGGRP